MNNMLKFLVNLLFICSLANSLTLKNWSKFTSGLKITGGDVAVPHAYPYQVGLIINKVQFCGGSLISKNYVLTAAHCAIEILSSVDIVLGAHNITSNETTQVHRKFSKIIIHEQYNYTSYQNDIALIKLYRPAPLTDAIKTISLISKTDANNDFLGEIVTSTGWGLTEDVLNPTIKNMSNVLRVVNVPVMDLEKCGIYYNDDYFNIQYITDNNICTSGDNKKGTCGGDSGGPLILDGVQIGVVSAGAALCEIGAPSVFTHIGKYLDWIQKNSDVVLRY